MPGEIVPFVQFPALDVQDMVNPVLVLDVKDICRVAVTFAPFFILSFVVISITLITSGLRK